MKILQPETAAALLLSTDSRTEAKNRLHACFRSAADHPAGEGRAGYQARSTPASARLRPSEVRTRALNAAYNGVLRVGFRAVTIVGHTDTDYTTCLHVPSVGLVVAGDVAYNDEKRAVLILPADERQWKTR
jgi:hypothetical protein